MGRGRAASWASRTWHASPLCCALSTKGPTTSCLNFSRLGTWVWDECGNCFGQGVGSVWRVWSRDKLDVNDAVLSGGCGE